MIDNTEEKLYETAKKLSFDAKLHRELKEAVDSPYSSANDIAKIVEKDPALTLSLLKLANSAFYGAPRSISSVSAAVVMLGFNVLKRFVLSLSIYNSFNGHNIAIDMKKFWSHSFATAYIAKKIAGKFIKDENVDTDTIFCGAIIHDVGRLLLNAAFPDDYKRVLEIAHENYNSLNFIEEEILGISHTFAAEIISDVWNLPSELEAVMVNHHNDINDGSMTEETLAVKYADILAHLSDFSLWKGEKIDCTLDELSQSLSADKEELYSFTEELKNNKELREELAV